MGKKFDRIILKTDPENSGVSVVLEDVLFLSPAMYMIIGFARLVARKLGKEFIFTSLISDRENANATTGTHARGDGADIRTWGWSLEEKNKFANKINRVLNVLAPEGKNVAVIEEDHIHLQARADYTEIMMALL